MPETKNSQNDQIKEICMLLSKIQDENLIFDFFGCLFTKSELKDFSKRWSLVKELDEGTTQREIAKKYNLKDFELSQNYITRGSREMKKEKFSVPKSSYPLEIAEIIIKTSLVLVYNFCLGFSCCNFNKAHKKRDLVVFI